MRSSTITLSILSVLFASGTLHPAKDDARNSIAAAAASPRAGSTAQDAQKESAKLGKAHPAFETVEQIMKMRGRKGTVERKTPCSAYLKASDGTGFYVGTPASPAEVGLFLMNLQEGKTYSFPDVFLDYQKKIVTEIVGPVSGVGWPEAIANLVNDESRFYGREFVPCLESTFFYTGDAVSFNRLLKSAGEFPGTQLVIHLGSKQIAPTSVPQFLKSVDWELHADREPTRPTPSGFKTASELILGTSTTAISVHLWLGGQIKWDEVKVPSTIRVKSDGELEEFIRRHNRQLEEEQH